ncbi:hypothetical protein BJA5080_05094 [Bradyrhizobium diazoefficiens SEMIA 5080]|uniref:Uncharacterized protein n=1 Tax=Bradyrhizobium diazoefficiens SEMIA 5080 TaxID=754504 RepID=A0A837CIJ8_9BRAD|nr:hypothetical protein BJA5080_05094 [Bradyrhizobium diazoefficiens SEMIA 5080]
MKHVSSTCSEQIATRRRSAGRRRTALFLVRAREEKFMKSVATTKVVIFFPFRSGAEAVCAVQRDIIVAIGAVTT